MSYRNRNATYFTGARIYFSEKIREREAVDRGKQAESENRSLFTPANYSRLPFRMFFFFCSIENNARNQVYACASIERARWKE